jgi:hypothetical protein
MEKLKQLIIRLNSYGIPLPLLHDPKSDAPSVTMTMMVLSFNLVLFGLIGKYAKGLDIDMTQAMYLFLTTSGLYLGRKMQNDGKHVILENNNTNEEGK